MRLRVSLDRLERGLTRPPPNGWSRRFLFPPIQTPFTKTVGSVAVLRHALFCLLLLIAYVAIFFIFLPLIATVVALIYYNKHHVHHAPWHLFALLYSVGLKHLLSQGTPVEYAFILSGGAVTILVFLFALRWAWNRRADRLNREAILPHLALTTDRGVWPPPPVAYVPTDGLPKK